MKRLLDLVLSLLALIVLAPLLLVVMSLVRLIDGAPVFFRQERIGRGGRKFRLAKFRTMKNSPGGPALTVGGDARITTLGRWLRKTKIDELPQLWNVVCGEMSFVGPRPEVKKYVDLYLPPQRKVLELQPGITDPASLVFFDESELLARQSDPEGYYIRTLMPEKIRINLLYAQQAHIGTDVWIIALTALRIFGLQIDFMSRLERGQHG